MRDNERGKSLVGIAIEGVKRAPLRTKLALVANIALLLGVSVYTVLDLGEREHALTRVVALSLTMGGATLLSLASVMWTMSQHGAGCGFFEFKKAAFDLRTRRLDEVLVAFPVFVFIAGCLIAAGLATFGTIVDNLAGFSVLAVLATWFLYWTTSMIASTSRFLYTHAREQAAAAERARSAATESQLAALQAQVNPHFLFNTLNTVASLVRTDAGAAEATVENLAVVLRRTLDRSRRVLSTVDDEIDHLAAYISVAKQRFEDRLRVHWAVDPATRELLVPTMTLQPLVENSLKHGIGARLEGGALHVGVQLEQGAADGSHGARLVLEVADDGPGFPRRHSEGTGLSNLRARLAALYGEAAELRVDRSVPGSRVIVSVPVVRSADEVLGAGTLDALDAVVVRAD